MWLHVGRGGGSCRPHPLLLQYEYGFDTLDMEIIDTAGEEEFMMFRDCSLARADAFLALFALNSLASFRDLKGLISKIIREHDDDDRIPIVVLANKRVSTAPEGVGRALSLAFALYTNRTWRRWRWTSLTCSNTATEWTSPCWRPQPRWVGTGAHTGQCVVVRHVIS